MALINKIFVNGKDEEEFFRQLEERNGETDKKVTAVVSEIIDTVKAQGDKAVMDYTKQFDGVKPKFYEVPREVINDALTEADQKFVDALLNAMKIFPLSTQDKNLRALSTLRKTELFSVRG